MQKGAMALPRMRQLENDLGRAELKPLAIEAYRSAKYAHRLR
jgi:hypothetical protein